MKRSGKFSNQKTKKIFNTDILEDSDVKRALNLSGESDENSSDDEKQNLKRGGAFMAAEGTFSSGNHLLNSGSSSWNNTPNK